MEQTALKEETKTITPKLYRVWLLNDDFTTMDFVVEILCDVFDKGFEEAVNLMFKVHKEGKAICGVYTFEIAETKTALVHKRAREHGFPLRAKIEEEK
jgi:ATP-dependent Clp protease adaptor protein ClpS